MLNDLATNTKKSLQLALRNCASAAKMHTVMKLDAGIALSMMKNCPTFCCTMLFMIGARGKDQSNGEKTNTGKHGLTANCKEKTGKNFHRLCDGHSKADADGQ